MLKKSISTFLLILLAVGSFSFRSPADKGIRLNISGLRNNKGHVLVSLFKDGAGYPDVASKAYRREKLDIKNGTATCIFPVLPSATYAIAVLHDENDDQRMNKSFFGLPKEGYGFSNNAMGVFGPPSYQKASITYKADNLQLVQIKMRY